MNELDGLSEEWPVQGKEVLTTNLQGEQPAMKSF